ncbi:AMP-binding protein [Micrococcus sp. FDAARGOS_333]|uniref:AMP-binding protein n=1 Tax=Micrococcus sp. FDAARGOS_333 TaxID=1930558 RepID=UPI000B4E5F64|nr:class I adenylate-forming enzyme family protein [Micrococcus sp. FDAARGOS_333]PNL16792.1 long-chain fatty acid--CoA ligase [Micrococcus sp. FDAARGOS_333]
MTSPAPRPRTAAASARLAPLRRGGPGLDGTALADHAAVLSAAVQARARGLVPLVGDDRWSARLWEAQTAHAAAALDALAARHPDLAEQAAWAAFTSGSTGSPRVVLRTDASWEAGHRQVARWLGLDRHEALLLAAHPVSSMAVNVASFCAFAGVPLRVPGRARLRARDLLPDDGSGTSACALAGTPSHLVDALDLLEELPDRSAATVRVAAVGGDRLPAGLCERAVDLGVRVVHYYGSAETSYVAVDMDGTGLRPLPGVEVRVVDGMLHVRSDQLALPDDSVLADGSPRFTAEGWLRTGDRARLDCGGVLHLGGRLDDAIQTGGATVVPSEVEQILTGARDETGRPWCTAALVLGEPAPRLGQRVVAWVETVPGTDPDAAVAALRRAAAEHLPAASRPRAWHAVDRLERTGTGKVRRLRPPAPEVPA